MCACVREKWEDGEGGGERGRGGGEIGKGRGIIK